MCLGAIYLMSLLLILGGVCKPKFFWNSRQVLVLRRRFGDRGTQIFYGGIGISLLLIACIYYSPMVVGVNLVRFLIAVAAAALLIYCLKSTSKCKRLARQSNQTFIRLGLGEKFQKRFEEWNSASLKRELQQRVKSDTAERLMSSARIKNPGKSERWYLEKVLYDLKRGR